jgi:hypothetical protein
MIPLKMGVVMNVLRSGILMKNLQGAPMLARDPTQFNGINLIWQQDICLTAISHAVIPFFKGGIVSRLIFVMMMSPKIVQC